MVLGLVGILAGDISFSEEKKMSTLQKTPQEKTVEKTSEKTSKETQWRLKMRDLYQTLAHVLSNVTNDRRFHDPANRARIEKDARKLSALAHDLDKKVMSYPDGDPTLPIVAGMLSRETKRAVAELKRDNRKYAQMILRSVPAYCISCHTRNPSGSEFAKLPLEPISDLSAFEKGEFFAASRQFDRAQEQYLNVIRNTKEADAYSLEWERAIQRSLMIAVRVKKSPEQGLEIVETVLKEKSAPLFMKGNAEVWKRSLTEWRQEPKREAVTEEGLYAEALRLMARARELQKYPIDRTADVLYLRATATLHELLQLPKTARQGEAFFLGGVAYEVLNPIQLESLHEIYYEACIRKIPHSNLSESCYRRLEEAVFLGYTGSSGTHVPADIRAKLKDLKSLSQIEPIIQK